MGEIIKENGETGELEIFDEETGEKLATQSRRPGHKHKNKKTHVKRHTGRETVNILTPQMKRKIIDLALEGASTAQIAREIGKYPRVLYRWFINHPDFRAQFQEAKKVRALYFEDQMSELVRKTTKEEQVRVNKFKFEAYKTLGEINDPDRYQKKQGYEQKEQKPIQIVFSTGIDRSQKKELKDIKVDISGDNQTDSKNQSGENTNNS